MYTTNLWYFYSVALDKITCDKIKNVAESEWYEAGIDLKKDITVEERKTGAQPLPGIDKNERISDIVSSSDQWIYDTVWPWMIDANERVGWKYDIKSAEPMQITRYKKGEFYNFHKDGKGDHLTAYNAPINEFMHGYVRKLSMTVLLNDDYEGGEFQFADYNQEKCEIITPKVNKTGSIILFPSDVEHRVTPVTKGIRYSLVVWFLGPPFK